MITLKIQAKTDKLPELLKIMSQYSSACHYAYNRTIENKSEKEIRPLLKKFNIGSWLQQCAIKDAISIKTSRDELEEPYNIIFGGKENFYKRLQGKITKAEWKICRLRPIEIQGEANSKSNRNVPLNMIDKRI
jgi:predicted transposase